MDKRECTPIVIASNWGDTIPKWLLGAIELERLAQGFAALMDKPVKEEVGDAEVCAYLYTLNLAGPVHHEIANIYMHLATKLVKQHNPKADIPKDIQVAKLSPDEERELTSLRRDLYRKRGGEYKLPILQVLKEVKRTLEKKEKQSIRRVA